ncbi:MAG: fibronectin type III domain-containing protein, partial [Eubacterium sp.]|nr:fibronectin type III domain-containing protein [Eubacterium sp.]
VTYNNYARNIVLAPGNASVSVLRGTVDCEIKQDSESGTDNQMYVYAAPEVTQMNLRLSGASVTVDGEAGTEAERWANNNHYTFLRDESSGNPGLQNGTYSDGTFLFKAADGKATIISYLGTDQEVEVPEVLSGCVVSGLGSGVFGAKAVNLRDQYVTKIHLPKTLQEAEPSAFWPLKHALPGVSYSTPVTITLDPENPYLAIEAGALYNKEKTRLITVIPGVISTEIAASAETIGEYAFAHSNVRTVTLPDSIRVIEKSAFSGSALETIEIGTGTEEIGDAAFSYCRSLKYAELPENLKHLGTGAFSHCSGLEYMTAGDRMTEIGERVLYESSGSFCGIEGSDFMLYLKKNHPKNAGRGFLIGDYVVGAQIEKDPSANVTDYTHLSNYGMSGYLLQLTRPVKVISGMSRYMDSKTGDEVSSILIPPTSKESRQIQFLYLTPERMLPGDTTVYLSIDAELSSEFGRETVTWSSEGLWKGTTKADVWSFNSPTDQIDASMLPYLVGEHKARRLQRDKDLSGERGCCFGMAATAGMIYADAPSLKRLGKKTMAAVLADDRMEELNGISVKEFIQLVFLMQKLPEYDRALNQNKNNLKGFVYDFNQYLYHGGKPLIFGYQYNKQNTVSHALFPIRWADGSVDENGEFLTNTPEMLVYDCTDRVDETRIRLYVKGGEVTGWEYPGHDAGSADHRWMKYAMIPESFYTLAKGYRKSVTDPLVNYAEQKLLDFCTENAEFAKQKLSAQSGDLASEISGDDAAGNLLIPVPSMDAAETEAGKGVGTEAGIDPERANYYFWVEGKDSVSIGGIPEDTGVSLTGETSDVEVTSSKTAAVILSAADTPDEVTAAVVKTEEPSAFRVAAEYNEKESPGTISAFSIEGQSDGTELAVSDEDDKVHVTGAETAVIEIRSGETVLTQKVESLSDYTSVEVELVSDPQSGEQAIVTRGDKDGDGNADEVVQPVSEGENQKGGNQGSGTQGSASSKDTENASGNASQKPASGQDLQSAAKPAGSPVPAAEEIEAITISKKPSIKKPAASKNKITVKWSHFKHKTKKTKKIWKKIKKVQVQCASDKSFTTIVKNVRVSRKKTKAVIRGLKRKTTYYVRVRYYDGTGYSKWSKVKKIKTKA